MPAGSTISADLDAIIEACVKRNGTTLFSRTEGAQSSRYFHLSGHPPHECFQVGILPHRDDSVIVQAMSNDTNDDSEFSASWQGKAGELEEMLNAAVAQIGKWKDRQGIDDPSRQGAIERSVDLAARLIVAAVLVSILCALATMMAQKIGFRSYWNVVWIVGFPLLTAALMFRQNKPWIALTAFVWLVNCSMFLLLNIGGS